MGFQQGLSGLNGASKGLDALGNNIANASTVGFKASQAHFADVFANSLGGSGGTQVGIGTGVVAVAQQFTQGNVTTTNNPLDLAINGNGFFRMSDGGTITYTRNGQFHLDQSGYIVDDSSRRLTGYPIDATGNIVQATPTDLLLSAGTIAPSSTTQTNVKVNLDARAGAVTSAFNPSDPSTFTNSTSLSVYDSLGFAHTVSLYFSKNAGVNSWQTHATVDGTAAANVNLGAGAGNPAALAFNTSGALTSGMPLTMSIDLNGVATALGTTNGAAAPLSFSLDLTGSTQFGSVFGVNSLTQDGFASGQLAGVAIASDGTIFGRYSNGRSDPLGQVVLTNFNNVNGLAPLGGNQFAETSQSGLPQIGTPGSSNLGAMQSAAVEESNVDMTAELVKMIIFQRVYQANAQTIKTQDAILQTLVNIR